MGKLTVKDTICVGGGGSENPCRRLTAVYTLCVGGGGSENPWRCLTAVYALCLDDGRTRKSLSVPDGLSWFTRCWQLINRLFDPAAA